MSIRGVALLGHYPIYRTSTFIFTFTFTIATMALGGNPYYSSRHQPSAVSSYRKKKHTSILLCSLALSTTILLIHYSTLCSIFPVVEAELPMLPSLPGRASAVSAGNNNNMPVSAFVPKRLSSKSLLFERYQNQGNRVHGVHISVMTIRGGGVDDAASEDEDEVEEAEEEEESSDDEYESEEEEGGTDVSDDEEEEEQELKRQTSSSLLKSSMLSKSSSQKENGELSTVSIEYDTLLTPPAMQQLFISIGVMLLSNRIDILDAKAVRLARIAFLAYIIVVQLFLLYVRLQAKSMNDRTPVMISSPLASLLPAAVTGGSGAGGNSMVKTLADQVLSTQTTILEYDLKQAKQMNGSLLFPMIFNYFLHFKMKQVQPLIMQTATGMVNLVYSPLFQVYVLGRNLERPFKQPVNPMMDALQQQQEQEQNGEAEVDESAGVDGVEVEEVGSDDDDEDEDENDDDNDGDDEYDNSDDE
jgi:hypothetical protein